MMISKKDVISTLQEIYFDLKYLRDKVVIDREVKEEISQRMAFIDECVNAIFDGIILVNEESK